MSQRRPDWALGPWLEVSALCDQEMQISVFEPSPSSLEHRQHHRVAVSMEAAVKADFFFPLKKGRAWDKAHVLHMGGVLYPTLTERHWY